MKTKLFSLLSLSVLFLVMFMGAVSAATYTETFDNSNATGTYGDNSFLGDNDVTWTFDNSKDAETYSINGVSLQFEDTTSKIISDTISGGISNFSVNLAKATTSSGDRQVELFINDVSKGASEVFDDSDTHIFTIENIDIEGDVVIEIRNVLDTQIVVDDITWTDYIAPEEEPEEITACELVGEGSLGIDITDITVTNGFGDDEEWLSLDEIEVEIEVENTHDDEKIKDIKVEWGLWSEETNEWVIELDEVDEFDVKEDSEETIIVNFKLNEKKLDVNFDELDEGDYTIYVIANGEEQEEPEFDVCSFNSEAVKIFVEGDFIVLNNFELNGFELEDDSLFSESVQCGADIEITADVWNIGDSDQEDVYVIVYNKELGIINEKIEIGDIDAFEDEKLVFKFKVPEDLEEKWYALDFRIYDEDGDLYENDYDDDKSEFSVSLKTEGNCIIEPQVMVTASLESGGEAGKELVIKATITNTENSLATYTLNPEEYNEWAELISVEPSAIILEAGESKDVLITLNVNKDVSGDKLFNIEVLSEDESIMKQPVSVTIEKSEFGLSALTGNIISEGNWYLWGIGALNVILVIVIILVAVKVAKKSE